MNAPLVGELRAALREVAVASSCRVVVLSGKGRAFFAELGPVRSETITAMSMDMGPAFEKSAKKEGHATKAVICFDPFHVVEAGTNASTRSVARSGRI